MTLHICTAGTSVTGKPPKDTHTVAAMGEAGYREMIGLNLAEKQREHPDRYLVEVSAETHGLFRSEPARGDEIVFLASDTDDGRICGEMLATHAEEAFAGVRARSIPIEGLQVVDARRFRREGVDKLFAALDSLTEGRRAEDVRLNVSGGFKGVVPFVTLYAMFHDFEVVYVYERSEALISLPAFPVEFDWSRVTPAAEAVLSVERHNALPRREIEELLPTQDVSRRRAFWSLFQPAEDDTFTLSAVGLLMYDRLERLTKTAPVALSPSAAAAFDEATGRERVIFETMLERLRIPLMRQSRHHADSLHNSDLRVWKRYSVQGPRMLYWEGAERIHVAELFAHDDYDHFWRREPKSIADYDPAQFRDHPPAETATAPDAFLEELDELRIEQGERIEALKSEIADLTAERERLRTQANQSATERQKAVERARSAEREKRRKLESEKDGEIAGLSSENADLRARIAALEEENTEISRGNGSESSAADDASPPDESR